MNWIRENPFVTGLVVVTLVATGALIFLLTGSMQAYREVAASYTQAVTTLHTLQNRSPFPNAENFEKARALAEEYKADLKTLHAALAKREMPLNPEVSPNQFQDDLRKAVNDITERATAAEVGLPANFYLGFDSYRDNLPSQQAAPALARQLAVITQIVGNLIDYKILSLDSLDRPALPEEKPTPDKPGDAPVRRFPLDISFTAEQAKFRVAINSLLTSDQFFIIRALRISNSNPVGPQVVPQGAETATAAQGAQGAPAAAEAGDLNVILGRESVHVTLKLEILDFTEPK